MRRLGLTIALGLAWVGLAPAAEGDGAPFAFSGDDPYYDNTTRTVGRITGFRELFVDPDAFASSLGRPEVVLAPIAAFDEDPADMLLGFLPVVHLEPDPARMEGLGLSIDQLLAALPAARHPRVSADGDVIHLHLSGPAELEGSDEVVAELLEIEVPLDDGDAVSLRELVEARVGPRQSEPLDHGEPDDGGPADDDGESDVVDEAPAAAAEAPAAADGEPEQTPDPEPEGPPAPPVAARGDLPVVNPSSAWATVYVEGTRVGVVRPFTEALIRDVRLGSYRVALRAPNGFTVERRVATVSRSPGRE